jgi:transposase
MARDQKREELVRSRTLNPHPEEVHEETFASSEFFDARDLLQVKYEMVRKVEAEGSSISAAAGAFGLSRQTYYSAAAALAEGGLSGLLPAKPGPKGAHKLTSEVLKYLEQLRSSEPSLVTSELVRVVEARFSISVHPRSIERALSRREAARTPKSGSA